MNKELPKLPSGTQFVTCITCPARTWDKEKAKYICDEENFTSDSLDIARLRPLNCPKVRDYPGTTTEAILILRGILKK